MTESINISHPAVPRFREEATLSLNGRGNFPACVIPAKAGTQENLDIHVFWVPDIKKSNVPPAFAGATAFLNSGVTLRVLWEWGPIAQRLVGGWVKEAWYDELLPS